VLLDLTRPGLCNLCNRKHSEPTIFTLSRKDPVLGAEIHAQSGAQCVAETVARELRRKELSARERLKPDTFVRRQEKSKNWQKTTGTTVELEREGSQKSPSPVFGRIGFA
jgi:hypothetical protein